MRDQYDSLESPKAGIMAAEKYDKIVAEISKALGQLNSTVRSIDQKVSLFGTSLDSQSSHEKLREFLDKGGKLVSKVEKRLKIVTEDLKGRSGPVAKARTATIKKLTTDFKTQLDLFTQSSESAKSARSYMPPADEPLSKPSTNFQAGRTGNQFTNYNEEQLLAQAQVTTYDEDDLMRRENDIIHINHQLREINAAYKEVDGLINDQHEIVVEIGGNVDDAQENAHKALEQVQQADARAKYCTCSKRKLICYGVLGVVFLLMVLGLIIALSKSGNNKQ